MLDPLRLLYYINIGEVLIWKKNPLKKAQDYVFSCTRRASRFYFTSEISHHTWIEIWLNCPIALKLKLINRMKSRQSKTLEHQSCSRVLIFPQRRQGSRFYAFSFTTVSSLNPRSQRCQYKFKEISRPYVSLLELTKVAVLLMVKPLWS